MKDGLYVMFAVLIICGHAAIAGAVLQGGNDQIKLFQNVKVK